MFGELRTNRGKERVKLVFAQVSPFQYSVLMVTQNAVTSTSLHYSCGLSTATIEYSSPSVCLSVCLSACLCTR